MKKLIVNNEGEKINVTIEAYDKCIEAYRDGFMFVYLKDINGNTHCVNTTLQTTNN